LHAAHIATSGSGEPLNIIHRDVSPQNILVGGDGIGRVFDFGVAKALGRLQQTRAGEFKGKLPYLAPEQFGEGAPDRRVDVYAASVTLWEALTTRRLFDGGSEEEVFGKILQGRVPAPSELRADVPPALDELVLRGLSRDPSERFASAEEMALALERAAPPATPREVSAWLQSLAGDALARRAALVTEMDGGRAPAASPAPASSAALPAPAAVPAPAASPAPAAPAPSRASKLTQLTVTQRITVPLQVKSRQAPVPRASSPTDSSPAPHPPLPDDSSTPPPLSLPVPEPGGRRRLVVRASFGALLLLCTLVAPAFGWMAFTGRQEAPRTVAAAATPAVLAAPRESSPKRTPQAEPARRLALPLPIEAAAPPPASVAEAKPAPLSSAKPPVPAISAAASAKPAQSHTFLKPKPAASSPDYWSSRAFAQRR
jgi:serine/threonine-protein kinase